MPPSSTPSEPNLLLATVKRALTDHNMLVPGDRVLVGVSGGPDSMALLYLLSQIATESKIQLGVAHLNHCLRGQSADRDADVVRQAAAVLRHPCYVGRAQVIKVKRKLGLSLEAAARRVRHAFFRKTMISAGYNKLALGHHQEDNAEQMLMALLRGAGPRGLSGIPPVKENRIIRPLISARRLQIEAFVAQSGINCVRDPSNDDLRFVRNRIRHHLLPLLASEYNPRIKTNLNQLAHVMRTEDTWIEELARIPYNRALLKRDKDGITLRTSIIVQAHPALARRLVRMAIEDLTGSLQNISFVHTQSVMRLLIAGGGQKEAHLPGGVRAIRIGNRLLLISASGCRRRAVSERKHKASSPVSIDGPFPATATIPALGINVRIERCRPHQLPQWVDVGRNQAFFDMDRLSFPLIVRPVAPGDRFTPLGATGSQKLNKFFIDHHLSRHERQIAVALTDQQRIIWLMGQRMDDHVKVTADTRHVLSVEFFLLDT